MIALAPSHPRKRPRGLWKGRRDAPPRPAEPELGSHAPHLVNTSDADDDDLLSDDDDDCVCHPSAHKRARLSSDDETLWHAHSPHSLSPGSHSPSPASHSLSHSPVSREASAAPEDVSPFAFHAYDAHAHADAYYHHTTDADKYYNEFLNLTHHTAAMQFPPPDALKGASINRTAKGTQRLTSDIEDWENLKQLFAQAYESYECEYPRHFCLRFSLLNCTAAGW